MEKNKKRFLIGSAVIVTVVCVVCLMLFSTKIYCGTVLDISQWGEEFRITILDGTTGKKISVQADIHTVFRGCHWEKDIYWGDFTALKEPRVEIYCRRFLNPHDYAETVVIQWNHDSETGIG